MGEQLPRQIDPKDIRVGDRIRCTDTYPSGDATSVEFRVIEVRDGWIGGDPVQRYTGWPPIHTGTRVWQLLYRPEPPREVGSLWRDPVTGAKYIRSDDHRYMRYRKPGDLGVVFFRDGDNDHEIARLVPLDAS